MQTAKLFPNGQSQAVRLPKEFRFAGDRVYIQRAGAAVVLLPYQRPWQVLFASLADFSADFSADFAAPAGEVHTGETYPGAPEDGAQEGG